MIRHRRDACLLLTFCVCLLAACGGGDDNPTGPGGGGGGDGDGTWDPPEAAEARYTGSLNVARNQQTATLLQDGRVLVTGGFDGLVKLASCEIYDPEAETWSLTASLSFARVGHTATLLEDGRVIVTGGTGDPRRVSKTFEIYDPETGTWSPILPFEYPYNEGSDMRRGRSFHAATRLLGGNVLFTGGFSPYRTTHIGGDYEHTYEFYLPDIGQFDWTEPPKYLHMQDRRCSHSSTLLTDGRVLLAGGYNHEDDYMTACEIYDAEADTCVRAAPMMTRRIWQGAFRLDDGRVFVCGGKDGLNSFTRTCEIYDPVADAWTAAPSMREPRNRPPFVRFSDGRVLAAGNISNESTEICVPGGAWIFHHDLLERRHLCSMTVFPNDVALVVGGLEPATAEGDAYTATCELYVP